MGRFLYPNAIQGIVSDNVDYIKNTKDVPRIEKLIHVIIVSALVMLGTLVFYIFKALLGNASLYVEHQSVIKYFALVFVFTCAGSKVDAFLALLKVISDLLIVSTLVLMSQS